MTTPADAWMLDTNVLLAATDESRPQHAASTELLNSVPKLTTCAQVLREYLVVATRPVAANGLGLSLQDALDNLRELRSRVRLLAEEKPILPVFLDLLTVVECRGKRIHDAHLVATAKLHRVGSIITLNGKDFAAFAAHVATLTPARALAASRGPR